MDKYFIVKKILKTNVDDWYKFIDNYSSSIKSKYFNTDLLYPDSKYVISIVFFGFKHKDETTKINAKIDQNIFICKEGITLEKSLDKESFLIQINQGKIVVQCPLFLQGQIYYRQNNSDITISNDLRLISRFHRVGLSDMGILSYFQFMKDVPGLSIFDNIKLMPLGSKVIIDNNSNRIEDWLLDGLINHKTSFNDKSIINSLGSLLENSLLEIKNPLVLFSGGVDSALIASLFTKKLNKKPKLVNFSFGDYDKEASFAKAVSNELDLSLDIIRHNERDLVDFFDRLYIDYSYPFSDRSIIPTNIFVNKIISSYSSEDTIIDGTGADGLYGIGLNHDKWKAIYMVPQFIREILASQYQLFYEKSNSVEKLLRIIKKSTISNINIASVMHSNSASSILYRTDKELLRNLNDNINNFYIKELDTENGEDISSVLDVLHICATIFSAKTSEPLKNTATNIVYPYMDNNFIKFAYRLPNKKKIKNGVAKYHLKQLLSKYLPSKYIYRNKSGFTPRFDKYLKTKCFNDFYYSYVFDTNNPILDYINSDRLELFLNSAKNNVRTNDSIYNFIWSVGIISSWLYKNRNSHDY